MRIFFLYGKKVILLPLIIAKLREIVSRDVGDQNKTGALIILLFPLTHCKTENDVPHHLPKPYEAFVK